VCSILLAEMGRVGSRNVRITRLRSNGETARAEQPIKMMLTCRKREPFNGRSAPLIAAASAAAVVTMIPTKRASENLWPPGELHGFDSTPCRMRGKNVARRCG